LRPASKAPPRTRHSNDKETLDVKRRVCIALTSVAAVFCGGILLAGAAGQAEEGAAAPGQYKIGIVDIEEVFKNYGVQKTEYEKLRGERDSRQAELDKIEAEVKKLREKYDAEKESMTGDVRSALEEDINTKSLRWRSEFERLQKEIDIKEKNLLTRLMESIHTAIQEVGAKENFHLILEAGQAGRSGVLYSSPTLSITGKVVDYLNRVKVEGEAPKRSKAE